MPPARVLNIGNEAGAGYELEASTKATPHLPVFAVAIPPLFAENRDDPHRMSGKSSSG